MPSHRHAAALVVCVLTWPGAAPVNAAQATAPGPSLLFAAYQRFCLAHEGEAAQALALAASTGWVVPAPDDRLPLGTLSMADGQQRETEAAGERLHLTVGHAADPAGLGLKPTPWKVCIVSSETRDAAAAPALAAWAAVPPARAADPADGGGATLFLVTPSRDGVKRSAAGMSDAQIQALVDARRIVAVGSNITDSTAVLLYAAPAP